jgi:hypothetical protein
MEPDGPLLSSFSFHHRVQTGCGSNPASYPAGTRVHTPEVKRPVCEAEFKNALSYNSAFPYVFMPLCLVVQEMWLHDVVLS